MAKTRLTPRKAASKVLKKLRALARNMRFPFKKMSATSGPSKPLENFTLFPHLPIELRLRIYDEMMPDPRIIEVMWKEYGNQYYTHSPVPIILQICVEARQHALKRYHRIEFENVSSTRPRTLSYHIHIIPFWTYMDYTRDLLFFHLGSCPRNSYDPKVGEFFLKLGAASTSRIQHLVLDGDGVGVRSEQAAYWTRLTGLRNLSFVMSNVCLSTIDTGFKNFTPCRKIICARERDVGENAIRRWDYYLSEDAVDLAVGASEEEGFVDEVCELKQELRSFGMDEGQVEAMHIRLIDIVKDEPEPIPNWLAGSGDLASLRRRRTTGA